jgi:hypothetical protein
MDLAIQLFCMSPSYIFTAHSVINIYIKIQIHSPVKHLYVTKDKILQLQVTYRQSVLLNSLTVPFYALCQLLNENEEKFHYNTARKLKQKIITYRSHSVKYLKWMKYKSYEIQNFLGAELRLTSPMQEYRTMEFEIPGK